MKASSLIICILSTALVTTGGTSLMWILAGGLRAPPAVVLHAVPMPSMSPGVAPSSASSRARAAAGRTAAADPATPTSEVAHLLLPPALTIAPPAPTALPAPDLPQGAPDALAMEPEATASAAQSPTAAEPETEPPSHTGLMADQPRPTAVPVDNAPVASAVAAPEAPIPSADAVVEVSAAVEPPQETIYHETYVGYFGFDEAQVRTIPWYTRHFHLDEDELLTICYIARAANVPFGPAVAVYVDSCGSSFQNLLGYYQLSPQVFLILPDDGFRCPYRITRGYEWQRRGAHEAISLSNREYMDLLAFKVSCDYLHRTDGSCFDCEQPLRILCGHPERRADDARYGRVLITVHGEQSVGLRGDARTLAAVPAPAGLPVIVGEDGVHRLMRSAPTRTASGGPAPVFLRASPVQAVPVNSPALRLMPGAPSPSYPGQSSPR